MPFVSSGIFKYAIDLSTTTLAKIIDNLKKQMFTGRLQGIISVGKGRDLFIAMEFLGGRIVACEVTITDVGLTVKGQNAIELLKEFASKYVNGYLEVRELTSAEVDIDLRYNSDAIIKDETVLTREIGVPVGERRAEVMEIEIEEIVRRAKIKVAKLEESRAKEEKPREPGEKVRRPDTIKDMLAGLERTRKDLSHKISSPHSWAKITCLIGRFVSLMKPHEFMEYINAVKRGAIAFTTPFDEGELRGLIIVLDKPRLSGLVLKGLSRTISGIDKVIDTIKGKGVKEIMVYEIDISDLVKTLSIDVESLAVSVKEIAKEFEAGRVLDRDRLIEYIKGMITEPLLCDPTFMTRIILNSRILRDRRYDSVVEFLNDLIKESFDSKESVIYGTCSVEGASMKLIVYNGRIVSASYMVGETESCDLDEFVNVLKERADKPARGIIYIVPKNACPAFD